MKRSRATIPCGTPFGPYSRACVKNWTSRASVSQRSRRGASSTRSSSTPKARSRSMPDRAKLYRPMPPGRNWRCWSAKPCQRGRTCGGMSSPSDSRCRTSQPRARECCISRWVRPTTGPTTGATIACSMPTPARTDRTHLILTTDHGRGHTATDWRDHGEKVTGADAVWIAFVSPRLAARGEWRAHAPLTTSQIASTIAAWMGVDWQALSPDAAPPLQPRQ